MRAPCTSIFWGTYLRLADLRHRLANIIVAVPRSTESRRVVEHSGAGRRLGAAGSETAASILTPSPAHPDHCTGGLPSRASKSKPTSAKTTLDKPFHIIARSALVMEAANDESSVGQICVAGDAAERGTPLCLDSYPPGSG